MKIRLTLEPYFSGARLQQNTLKTASNLDMIQTLMAVQKVLQTLSVSQLGQQEGQPKTDQQMCARGAGRQAKLCRGSCFCQGSVSQTLPLSGSWNYIITLPMSFLSRPVLKTDAIYLATFKCKFLHSFHKLFIGCQLCAGHRGPVMSRNRSRSCPSGTQRLEGAGRGSH